MNSRLEYLDILRIISTFSVIVIHIFGAVNIFYLPDLTDFESYIFVVLRNLWQWCIPLFVMITGVLFLYVKEEISYQVIIKKYFLRIIYAIFLFGIPFALLEIIYNEHFNISLSQLLLAITEVIQGRSWGHLWYLYMIAGLYLFIPMIKIYIINSNKNSLQYLLFVLFFFTSIVPFCEKIFLFRSGFYIPINSVYFFYLILGYYLHKYTIKFDYKFIFCFILFYISSVILMSLNNNFITSTVGREGDSRGLVFLDYNSPIVVLCSVGIFSLFRQIRSPKSSVYNNLSGLCFGIYIIHPVFINLLYKLYFIHNKFSVIPGIIITFFFVIISSIFFTYLLTKIKIFREYIL